MPRARIPFFAVVVLAATAAPALAAWEPPQAVTRQGSEGRSPAVAVSSAGDAALAWVNGSWRRRSIAVSTRGRDGTWDSPVRVSPREGVAIDPAVAVDGSGRVMVAWRQTVGRQTLRIDGRTVTSDIWVTQARRRDSFGIWGPIVTLSPSRLKVGPPVLAMDDGGGAVVAWHWGTGTSPLREGFVGQVQAATFEAGQWSAARRVSGVAGCRQERRPDLATGPAGHTVLWWQCDVRGGSRSFAVSRSPQDRDWSARREMPFRTAGDRNADMGVGADGTVVAISAERGGPVRWWRGAITADGVSLAALPVPPAATSGTGGGAGVDISVPADVSALSGWRGSTGAVRVAPVAAVLGAGSPVTLSRQGGAPQIAASGARRGVAAWLEPVGGRGERGVMASTRDGEGIWSQVRRISLTGPIASSSSPRLAVSPRGLALVAWQRTVDGKPVVERAAHTP